MIYLVRHGQTDANIGKQKAGDFDPPLNATGIKQAQAVRDELKDIHFDAIYSSTYQRAKKTAEIINQQRGIAIIFDDRLKERHAGDLNNNDGEQNMSGWHKMFDADNELIVKNGELLESFFDRVYSFIDDIKSNHAADENILVVAHGGVQHAFYAYFNKLPLKGNMRIDRMHNASVRKYDFDPQNMPTEACFESPKCGTI